MPHPVLEEDWSEYDNRKIRDGRDSSKFSCDEEWEVNYLVKKLTRYSPYPTESEVRVAIRSCCSSGTSRVREVFVACVFSKL